MALHRSHAGRRTRPWPSALQLLCDVPFASRQERVAGKARGMDAAERAAGERMATHPGVALAAALALAGCATPVLQPCAPTRDTVAWVANYGWHTEIILAASALTGPLAQFRSPGATALSFGFGKLDFMTVPSPGLGDFALGTIPGPATVRVVMLRVAPPLSTGSLMARLPLTDASLATLQRFLSAAIARGPDGAPIVAAAPPDADTRFYAATQGYSLAYTCNSWVADGLERAGEPMDFGIVFSGGVMASLARVSGTCAAN